MPPCEDLSSIYSSSSADQGRLFDSANSDSGLDDVSNAPKDLWQTDMYLSRSS